MATLLDKCLGTQESSVSIDALEAKAGAKMVKACLIEDLGDAALLNCVQPWPFGTFVCFMRNAMISPSTPSSAEATNAWRNPAAAAAAAGAGPAAPIGSG